MTVEELRAIGELKGLFATRNNDKSNVRVTAEEAAALTLPYILPRQGAAKGAELETPSQSLGAKAVNHLASKLLISLLPPNTPFFRLMGDIRIVAQLAASPGDELVRFEKALSNVERQIQSEIERQALRIPVFQALKHLIITGNSLMYKMDEGLKVYDFNQYVVERDYEGHVVDVIIKETISKRLLPMEAQELLKEANHSNDTIAENVEIYTRLYRASETKWVTYQEVEDVFIPSSQGSYNKNKFPYIVLRWNAIDGEHYGRGLVEQYLGDFRILEKLTKAVTDSAGLGSKTLFGIKPGSNLRPSDLATAANGEVFKSTDFEREVSVLRVEKGSDLQIAFQLVQAVERRISEAFLLTSSVRRDAERVSATEIRVMASELEDSLGGVYSVLSQEFQLPLVKTIIAKMKLELPAGTAPAIVTGLEALNREHDLQKLQVFTQLIGQFSPEVLAQYMNMGSYIDKVAGSLGIDTAGLIKSPEQMQQEQQAAMQQQQQMMAAEMQMQGQQK